MKKNEKVMTGINTKTSKENEASTICASTTKNNDRIAKANSEGIFTVECDWGDEEISLHHDKENGNSFITNTSKDFCILNCPASVDDLDEDIVLKAVRCHYDTYSTYRVKQFTYDNLEKQIDDVYKSIC